MNLAQNKLLSVLFLSFFGLIAHYSRQIRRKPTLLSHVEHANVPCFDRIPAVKKQARLVMERAPGDDLNKKVSFTARALIARAYR